MTFDLTARLDLFGLRPADLAQLRIHAARLDRHVDAVVEAYYAHLERGEYAAYLRGAALDELKAKRAAHWRKLLAADLTTIRERHFARPGPCFADEGFPRSVFALVGAWFAVAFGEILEADPTLDAATSATLGRTLTRIAFLDAALCEESRNLAWID